MHAYITMKLDPVSPAIPIQYNYLIQAAIYSALPEDMATQLHDEGFSAGSRKYKMFSFSRLMGKYIIDSRAGKITFPEGACLAVSSPDMKFFLSLINNLLTKSKIRVGESFFSIEEVRFDEQAAEDDVLIVRTLSPAVTYSTLLRPEGGKYTCYFQPGEEEFNRLLTANLKKKYEAFHGEKPPAGEVRARPLDRPRLHVTSFKGTVVKGYTCRMKLSGPRVLLQIGLDAGLGGKGSQGYGCVERVSQKKRNF